MESAYIHGVMLKKIIICSLAVIVSGCSESDPVPGSSESVTYGGWESNLPDLVLPQTLW